MKLIVIYFILMFLSAFLAANYVFATSCSTWSFNGRVCVTCCTGSFCTTTCS